MTVRCRGFCHFEEETFCDCGTKDFEKNRQFIISHQAHERQVATDENHAASGDCYFHDRAVSRPPDVLLIGPVLLSSS